MKKTCLFLLLASMTLISSCAKNADTSSNTSQTESDIKVRISGDGTVMVGKTSDITVRVSHDTEDKGFEVSLDDESIATAQIKDDSTVTVTGKKVGKTVLTATSKADKTVSATLEINVVSVTNPTIKISADNTAIKKGGKIALTAKVTDYTGDVTYTWKSLYSKGTFSGDKTSNAVTYTGNATGSDTIKVSFAIGEELYYDTIAVTILADTSGADWTALSTADDVKNSLLIAGTISGKYYLANDIDLGGYEIPFTGSAFNGTLDGKGHSIKNYSVAGNPADKYSNGGFFSSIEAGGTISDIGFLDVTLGEKGSGWGTSVIACACSGKLENIQVSVTHNFDNSSLMDAAQWFPFCSAFIGIFKESTSYRNIVVDIATAPEDGYKTIFADVAYPAGGSAGLSAQTQQSFSVSGFYTNSTTLYGSVWEWGSPVEDQSGYTTGINWSNTSAETYTALDANVWTLAAGAKPTLKAIAD